MKLYNLGFVSYHLYSTCKFHLMYHEFFWLALLVTIYSSPVVGGIWRQYPNISVMSKDFWWPTVFCFAAWNAALFSRRESSMLCVVQRKLLLCLQIPLTQTGYKDGGRRNPRWDIRSAAVPVSCTCCTWCFLNVGASTVATSCNSCRMCLVVV